MRKVPGCGCSLTAEFPAYHVDRVRSLAPASLHSTVPCSPSDFRDFLLPTLDAVEPPAPSAPLAPVRPARSLLLEFADDPDESALALRRCERCELVEVAVIGLRSAPDMRCEEATSERLVEAVPL